MPPNPEDGRKKGRLTARVEVRLRPEQLALLEAAPEADDAGSLSDWAGRVLLESAKRQLDRQASSGTARVAHSPTRQGSLTASVGLQGGLQAEVASFLREPDHGMSH